METAKFKICPECGKHNPPNLLECRYCEADLTGVRVTDSDENVCGQKTAQDPDNVCVPYQAEELVRICECGAINPPQARKCRACGEDISDIIQTKIAASDSAAFSYKLRSLDGAFCVEISKPLAVLGREGELKEYLSGRPYVSRRHAKLTVADNKVYLENLSETNHTYVNNTQIPDEIPVELSDGDEIGLGGKLINESRQDEAAYFIIRLVK